MDSTANFAQDVLQLTNDFRAEQGLSPLTLNQKLTVTAQTYAQTMAEDDFFSHIGEDNSTPWERAEADGYTAMAMAENIAAGQPTPEQVVQSWIDSPGHRQNLLNPNYTELGVGYFELSNDTGQVNYTHYWTQLFGSGDLTPGTSAVLDEGAPMGLQEVLIEVMTLTEQGTIQFNQDLSYRLGASAERQQELHTGRHELSALIQVDSAPPLIDVSLLLV